VHEGPQALGAHQWHQNYVYLTMSSMLRVKPKQKYCAEPLFHERVIYLFVVNPSYIVLFCDLSCLC